MVCIFCRSETNVTNSRSKARTPSVWRRRLCKVCVAQFSTIELPDYGALIIEEARLPFNRDKLFLSIYKSLGHRPDALKSASELTSTVISHLLKRPLPNGSLKLKAIAKTAHEVLKRYDPLAAHTYRAYHLEQLKN